MTGMKRYQMTFRRCLRMDQADLKYHAAQAYRVVYTLSFGENHPRGVGKISPRGC